jgi:RNA polymerase sigma factor (TIGR02999 family)
MNFGDSAAGTRAMPQEPTDDQVTELLRSVADGDVTAGERLFPVVYNELHRIASAYMRQERPEHTLQPTALVHEAYLRLVGDGADTPRFENYRHFVAAAAVAMRRILVNHAKARATRKRGGGRESTQLDDAAAVFGERSIDLVALDEALDRLAQLDPAQARLVELRFFGGMSVAECARELRVSERTVHYEWAHARAWLRAQLEAS